jgi:Zn-dependent peptidase ImmA (M78 family)/transcriptional regulator with XRE-family HTH domain
MTFDLSSFGSKLKAYREQFDSSVDEVSTRTGISIQALTAFEKGERRPTGDEVLILADYYKCDYKFFISNERLAPFEQTRIMFRRYSDEFTTQDRWAVQEFLFLCECEAFLLGLMPQKDCKPFIFEKSGAYYKGHAEQAAARLRNHLGYSYNQVGRDIYADFRSLGFHVFRRQLSNSNLSGLFINHHVAGKCILINYSEDVYRQRFTACHETAHAILDDEEGFVVSLLSKERDLVEVRANTFASCYLMPPEFIVNIPDAKVWNPPKAIDWANRLRVSTEALAYALKNAGLITTTIEEQLKSVRVPSNMKCDPELPETLTTGSRVRREQLLKRGLSVFYVGLCFDAYERRLISSGRLAEMLLVGERELSEMASLYGRTIHYVD